MVSHALTLSPNDAESWLASLEGRYGAEHLAILKKAAAWLAEHGGEAKADTGEPQVTHSLGTAAILAGMKFDAETVAAALLCGLPEKAIKRDTLVPRFGAHLTALVEGATKLSRMDHLFTQINAEGGQSEAMRQMLLAMTDDIRVVFIKLAERTQALRELADQDEAKRRKVATDVRELYAPWPTAWASGSSSGSWRICPAATWSPIPTGRSPSSWTSAAWTGSGTSNRSSSSSPPPWRTTAWPASR